MGLELAAEFLQNSAIVLVLAIVFLIGGYLWQN